MEVLFHISKEALKDTYWALQRVLHGNDNIIFNAWGSVVANAQGTFTPPATPNEFSRKHKEIENRLGFVNFLHGRDLMMSLMEEIWNQVSSVRNVPGLDNNALLKVMAFQVPSERVVIQLTPAGRWAVKWPISLHYKNINAEDEIALEIQDRNWGEIVPLHILQFIHTAIDAYTHGMYASSVALLAICLEGTLRDVLVSKGYSFDPRALSVDEYPYTEADVGINGNSYTITFHKKMPKPVGDFLLSTSGASTVEVKVRRVIKSNNGRIDLTILAPSELIDHWSIDVPSRLAKKRVNGLGEALEIARRTEGFLTPDVLPEDFDEVFKVIRNNLIHSSENSLNVSLDAFKSTNLQPYTLKEFLGDQVKVYDLMVYVPKFINNQYVELRKSGHLAS